MATLLAQVKTARTGDGARGSGRGVDVTLIVTRTTAPMVFGALQILPPLTSSEACS
jgi:hypothetical protein